ncbi:SDR family NAD(P)-dependent oxidoreductase [Brevundimonas sp. Root1279]|uniref:SDR family NAD(P)-dependent oxidoreductase n=1 Tax=Brevundimonas sp. Root1279 TaxID=1736443 RepID=UPI0006F9216A|nr:SDR family NAD(P)-dependent oxidoreductase [Brevundimonas sp. Root1279]KQW83015.1 hypothetical protein ASC65_06670 [Brevundimonas sp. Root1279]
MTRRTFTEADQLAFAALSGDFNPLHVDPVRARRLMFGACAVHGVHTLLWALDQWAAAGEGPIVLHALKATFARPLRVDRPVEMAVRKDDGRKVRLLATSGDDTIARIDFEWSAGHALEGEIEPRAFAPAAPIEHATYDALSGVLPLALDPALASRLLPHLADRLASGQLASILALTRLVGMEAPGLHSVFSELDLAFAEAPAGRIDWRVEQADPRFGLLVLDVASAVLSGEVRAFIRPAPRGQLAYAEAAALVAPGEFAGQRALVIGGSRGLGEVCAKLLAAGGADVLLTYARGEADARALADEISAAGGIVSIAPFDVLDPGSEAGQALAARAPDRLYYFATPFIATGPKGGFSRPLFEQFCAVYVAGLADAAALLAPSLKAVFSPSSVFVEDGPDVLVEYATAKAAAEALCASLARHRGLKVAWPRLPKLDTDQTAALGEAREADPAPVLLEALRAFHAAG